ncbi:MAG: RagB/SusD family nutrient uptake outer membrane protein, partial [Clostridium sp.]|nr:RagB/SusD family nutrient uptake outer membrane protein [Clostridium sp.]
MKNIFKRVLTGAVVACSMLSCDYLDVSDELGGISSFENIFNNVDRTKKWYGQIFTDRPDYSNVWGATNAMGNAWTGYADEVYTREHLKYGKYSNWNSSLGHNHRWTRLYGSIRQANIFLEMAHPLTEEGGPDAPSISEEEMRLYKANARFMRAIYHYYLFEMYGPVPIVDKSYTLDNLPNLERKSVDEVVAWIDNELYECMQDMYQESYYDNELMRGVPSKGVAMAYRAKLWVYAASPLFNGSWEYGQNLTNVDGKKLFPDAGTKDEKIANAVKYLREFLDYAEAGRYELVDTDNPAEDLYNVFQDYNKEIIWATTVNSWGALSQETFDGHATPRGEYGGLNGIDMVQELVDDFYCSDGKPIKDESFMDASSLYNEDSWGKLDGQNVYGMYLNREPRFYSSVTFTGMKWASSGKRVEFAYGGTSGAGRGDGEPNTGHMVYKRYYRKLGNGTGLVSSKYRPSIIFRLAEFYLLYAEMLNEQSKGTDPDILVYVNKIRNRAGIPDLEVCNPDIAGNYTKL